MNSWYSIENAAGDGIARVDIFDEIGLFGITAKQFIDDLRVVSETAKSIALHINSPGGSVFEGNAIYNTIKQSRVPVDIYIDGAALSIASVIAMAGRKVHMAENALIMIHNPHGYVMGEERDMKKVASLLSKIKQTIIGAYVGKTGKSREDIAQMMDDETWMDADEAIDMGFADVKTEAVEVTAHFDLSKYGYTPPPLVAAIGGLEQSRAIVGAASTHKELKKMSDQETVSAGQPTKPAPASYEDIKTCCPGAPAEFICSQLERKATLDQAQTNWMEQQNREIAAAKARADEAEKKMAAKAEADALGVDTLGSKKADSAGAVDGGDVKAQWDALVEKFEAKGMTKAKAVSAAVHANRELHEQYLAVINEGEGRSVHARGDEVTRRYRR